MGQDNTRCTCCADNWEMDMEKSDSEHSSYYSESNQNSVNNSSLNNQSLIQEQEQNIHNNLKSYVNSKNNEQTICSSNEDNNANIMGSNAENKANNNNEGTLLSLQNNDQSSQNRPKQLTLKQNKSGKIKDIDSNFKQDSLSKHFFSKKSHTSNPFGKPKNRLTSIKTLPKYQHHIPKIILIQSHYITHLFNKKIYPILKPQLVEHLNTLVKDLYKKYLTPNLKQAESSIGIKHTDDSYKSLYSFNKSPGISNSIGGGGLRLFTKLYILKYNNIPSFYVGEVNIDNKFNGKGILTQSDGTKYNGTFENGIFKGVGQYFNSKGTLYEGYFLNGKLEGRATKKLLNGCMFIGNFVSGIIEGNGKEEWKDFVYEGQFAKNKKHGPGRLVYKQSGDIYEGDFQEDTITGYGVYKWTNGESYTGTVLNGKMHGKGIYKWPDGGEYEGDYNNNLKEGKGRFKWANGREFKGEFKNGRPNGKGVLYIKHKEYDVVFKNGKLHGKQIKLKNNGNKSKRNNLNNEDNNNKNENINDEVNNMFNINNKHRNTNNNNKSNTNRSSKNKKSESNYNTNNNIQNIIEDFKNISDNDIYNEHGNCSEEDDNFSIKRSKGNMINVDEYQKNNQKLLDNNNKVKETKPLNKNAKYFHENAIKEHNNEDSFDSASLDFVKKKKKVKIKEHDDIYEEHSEKVFNFSDSEIGSDNNNN